MTLKRRTPFIRRINQQGGSFYTFSSAAEDLILSFNDQSNRKFRFSKFVLLNIPDILNRPLENTIKLNAIAGAYNTVDFARTSDYNIHLAESFQNYCLNLETMILNSENYNEDLPLTVAERVFFKWLKEIGAIRFKQVLSQNAGLDGPRYFEEDNLVERYSRVVQYIGEIDVVNNFSSIANSYTEVYIHLPLEVGNTPNPLFKTIADINYAPNYSFCRLNDNLNNEIICGHSYDEVHPDGLDIRAFYDNDIGLFDGTQGLMFYKKMQNRDENQDSLENDYLPNSWWFPQTTVTNCYYLEPNEFTNPNNDTLAIKNLSNSSILKFKRSRLDGISIDFNLESYRAINQFNYKNFIDLNSNFESTDFEFNAILLYYDLYEIVDTEEGELVENILATNLFGVLFLDNVKTTSLGGGRINRFRKCRPNALLNMNGNSYGFKLNLKLDITNNINANIKVETIISDSNTLSMDIFSDALREIYDLNFQLEQINHSLIGLEKRIRYLEDFAFSSRIKDIDGIIERLDNLESKLINEKFLQLVEDKNQIISLIKDNNNLLNQILNQKADIKILADFDKVKAGPGIQIDTIKDKLYIAATNDFYFYPEEPIVKISNWNLTTFLNRMNEKFLVYKVLLLPGKNYLRFDDLPEVESFDVNHSIILYIDDSVNKWEAGQTYKLVFKTAYNMNYLGQAKNFIILTDALNKKQSPNGPYNVAIKIPASEFELHNNRPIIEIHCHNPEDLEFFIDIF